MKSIWLLLCVFALGTVHSVSSRADEGSGWYDAWLKKVTEIQAAQPHWATPLITVTPRLEQEFRTDFLVQYSAKGHAQDNFGGGKGLELIPLDPVEVILNVPPYLEHHRRHVQDGFGDFSMLVKYRLLSSNEEADNAIITAFLGMSFPTGTAHNGSGTSIFTPTIAAGKGLGDFDLQSTFGITLPATNVTGIGHHLNWNTAFQYHFNHYFWPEIEDNFSHSIGGDDDGGTQNYITLGAVFGKFVIHERTGFTAGAGYQIATSEDRPYQHALTVSARIPF